MSDEGSGLSKYIEYSQVQDKAFNGRLTDIVKIKDPCSGLTIATIRDPKVVVAPF